MIPWGLRVPIWEINFGSRVRRISELSRSRKIKGRISLILSSKWKFTAFPKYDEFGKPLNSRTKNIPSHSVVPFLFSHNSSSCSDENLTLKTSALNCFYGCQFTLSTHLIISNYLFILSHRRSTIVSLVTI